MAKLSAHGEEVIRYLSFKRRGLISVRSDGTLLRRDPWSGGWKLHARIKPGVDLERWIADRKARYQTAPAWMKQVALPSAETLREWESNGIAETPTGYEVEPDGHGPDGSPSWFLVLGLI